MKVLLFSDNFGAPLSLRHLPAECLKGIVGASIRPQYYSLLAAHAAAACVPFLVQPRRDDPRYEPFLDTVRELRPDILLVNSYSMRLPNEILEIASRGGVNIHGALLPAYRGANPIQWALINNETETGVTMHRLTAQFDAGDIIAQRCVSICLTDTWLDVQLRIQGATDELLQEVLPRVLEGRLQGTPQDEREARYYTRRSPDDGRIDWEQSVLQIHNLVRALVKPHPGAFYEVGDVRHVVDSYKSLAEITALKAEVGGLSLTQDNVSITPASDPLRPLDSVWFTVSVEGCAQCVGAVGVCDIDYRRKGAQLRFEGTSLMTDVARSAATWVAVYAANELELAHLDVESDAVRIVNKKILSKAMEPGHS